MASKIIKVVAGSVFLATITINAFAGSHHYNYKNDYKNEMPCPMPPSLQGGFYVGAQAGYDSYRVRQTLTDGGTFTMVGGAAGLVGGLNIGYGEYLNDFYYMAVEFLGNYNGTSTTNMAIVDNDGDTVLQKFKPKGTLAISLLPGIKLNDKSLGYLRVGYDRTLFYGSFSGSDGLAGSFSASGSSNEGAWDLGFGIETLLYQNWSVRTEYNHIAYHSFNVNVSGVNQEFNPSDNQIMLGVLYHFA